MNTSRFLKSTLGTVAALANGWLSAVEINDINIHGSISAGAAYSNKYNFYGETADKVDLNNLEAIVNGTYQWNNGIRAGLQAYAYDIGGYSDILLDWANVDYAFKPWLGARVGRNKLPQGLYNDTQDLDQVRVFANLPLSFYPKTYRSILNSYDGLGLYGNISLGAAGSLDYQVYGGRGDNVSEGTFLIDGLDNSRNDAKEWNIDLIQGASLFWNLPVDGLRLGSSYTYIPDTDVIGQLPPNPFIPPGADLTSNVEGVDLLYYTFSIEYTWRNLVLATESKVLTMEGTYNVPSFPPLNNTAWESDIYFAYVSASYQALDWLGLGAYYGYEDNNTEADVPGNRDITHDYCAAVSFNITDWWIIKLEGHYIDGVGLLLGTPDENPGATPPVAGPGAPQTFNDEWTYFVLKTTISF